MDSTPTTSPGSFCSACGARLTAGARFCHQCGAAAGTAPPAASAKSVLPWAVTAIALIAVVALLAGQSVGRRNTAPESASPSAPLAGDGGATRAPDISSMSPKERADRLFDRVMRYASAGKLDSAQFFAPMAMSAIEALAPLNAHHHYDLGLIALAAGDAARARSEADAILRAQPTHLLGLLLASRAAEARGDTAARDQFERKLLAAEPSESAKQLEEYADHENEWRAALDAARARVRAK